MVRIVLSLGADLSAIAAAGFAFRDDDIRIIEPQELTASSLDGADILVTRCEPRTLTPDLVALCDQLRVRIAPYAATIDAHRLAAAYGLAPLTSLEPDQICAHVVPAEMQPVSGGITVVWGPHGAPGRSRIAIELAAACARASGSTALIDADAHAPSIAMMLGLSDDGPGFASACRSAERRALDPTELSRVSQRVDSGAFSFEVLVGLNRPGRWPELSAQRVQSCLQVARAWADHVIVDVAASADPEAIMLDERTAPHRDAATAACLAVADHVVIVGGADPVAIARLIRCHADAKKLAPTAQITTVINQLRSGAVGVDARGQVRRTLARFAGIEHVYFVPCEVAAADAALLHARPIIDVAPKSGVAQGVVPIAEALGARAGRSEALSARRRARRVKVAAAT